MHESCASKSKIYLNEFKEKEDINLLGMLRTSVPQFLFEYLILKILNQHKCY